GEPDVADGVDACHVRRGDEVAWGIGEGHGVIVNGSGRSGRSGRSGGSDWVLWVRVDHDGLSRERFLSESTYLTYSTYSTYLTYLTYSTYQTYPPGSQPPTCAAPSRLSPQPIAFFLDTPGWAF